jgi:integrase
MAKKGRQPVRITKRSVDALAPGETIYDDAIRGFRAACLPSGRITFGFQYSIGGRRPYLALGLFGEITPDQARTLAERAVVAVKEGRDPAAEKQMAEAKTENTVDHVIDEWLAKYARDPSDPLRSADAIEDIFDRHVRPSIGEKAIYDVTRDDVVAMLDKVRDNGGSKGGGPMANRVHSHLKTVFEWWRDRDSKFITQPLTKKKPAKEKARTRFLPFDEVLDLWRASDELGGVHQHYWKAVLFCGGRRCEVSAMHSRELDKARENWMVPAGRYKTKANHVLPLTPSLKALLPELPKDGYVFSTTGGDVPISGFSKMKKAVDNKIAEIRKREGRAPMAPWQIRDLRRSCRTLMIGIGIPESHAKAVNGHKIPGVDGVYNVWHYRDEKAAAIEKFIGHIKGLLDAPTPTPTPSSDNVVAFKSAAGRTTRRRATGGG